MNVVSTKPLSDGKGIAKLRLTDGVELEAWTPELAKVLELGDKSIPEGWTLKNNKQGTGKILLPPKEGGKTAYRNTKEAFDAEAKSRREWQLVEEDRRDRRTALMQAVQLLGDATAQAPLTREGLVIEWAEIFYDWLKDHPSPAGPIKATRAAESPAGGTSSTREGEARVDSAPEQDEGEKTLPGERGAEPGTGGGDSSSASPGFPVDQATCDHKTASGRWVRWDIVLSGDGIGRERCPKCGMSKVSAIEGTTEDLGSA